MDNTHRKYFASKQSKWNMEQFHAPKNACSRWESLCTPPDLLAQMGAYLVEERGLRSTYKEREKSGGLLLRGVGGKKRRQ